MNPTAHSSSFPTAPPFGGAVAACTAGCGSPAPEPVVIRFEARFGERAAAYATAFEGQQRLVGPRDRRRTSTSPIPPHRRRRLGAAAGARPGSPWQNGASLCPGNVAYNATLTWAQPSLELLQKPLFGSHPVELGIAGHQEGAGSPATANTASFSRAVPEEQAPFIGRNVSARAGELHPHPDLGRLALRSFGSWRDRALSASTQRGLAMFLSEDFDCHHCHGGFTSAPPRATGAHGPVPPPTLRNVADTAPQYTRTRSPRLRK